jgi:hypothetical protein
MNLIHDVAPGDKTFITGHTAGSHLLKVGDVLMLSIDPGRPSEEIIRGEITEITPTEIHWKLVQ